MRTTRFPWLMLNSTKRRTASRRWSRSLGGVCCAKNSSAENTVGSAIASTVGGNVRVSTSEKLSSESDVGFLASHSTAFRLCKARLLKAANHILLVTRCATIPGRMLSPATTRASTRTVSHLVLAGYNPLAPPGRSAAAAPSSGRQAVSNPTPAQVPLSTWLASVGRESDVERGYRIKHVAGGAGHQLVSYRNYEGFGATPSLAPLFRPRCLADTSSSTRPHLCSRQERGRAARRRVRIAGGDTRTRGRLRRRPDPRRKSRRPVQLHPRAGRRCAR